MLVALTIGCLIGASILDPQGGEADDEPAAVDTRGEWSDAELKELGNMLVRGLSIEEITRRNVARFTIIYRVSRSLIRSRSQATPAFMMPKSCRGDVMRDLRADWRRWTRGERVAAVLIAIGMTILTPAPLLFGGG